MSIDVLLAVTGPAEALLAKELDAHPQANLSRRCADLAEALGAAEAGIGDVLVVTGGRRIDRRLATRLSKIGVVIVALAEDDDERARLVSCGCAAVAESAPAAEVAAAAIAARAEPPAEGAGGEAEVDPVTAGQPGAADDSASRDGLVIAAWGPVGAPGRSAMAANVAAELSADAEVLLVDADTYGAAQATQFGLLDEVPGIAAACRAAAAGELTPAGLVRSTVEIRPGLRLLSGLARADRWAEVSPAALDALWPVARAVADVTVVDCGPGIAAVDGGAAANFPSRDAATAASLAAADVVAVVGSCEPLGMQRLVHALADLGSLAPHASAASVVVVNRLRASAAGDRPEQAVADVVARFADTPEVWTVPHDVAAFDESARLGQALLECAPRSPARRAVAELAAELRRRGADARHTSAAADDAVAVG